MYLVNGGLKMILSFGTISNNWIDFFVVGAAIFDFSLFLNFIPRGKVSSFCHFSKTDETNRAVTPNLKRGSDSQTDSQNKIIVQIHQYNTKNCFKRISEFKWNKSRVEKWPYLKWTAYGKSKRSCIKLKWTVQTTSLSEKSKRTVDGLRK